MSLINQLLQDLDKRRSQPTEDVQLPQGTLATAVSARTRMPYWGVWLLALLVRGPGCNRRLRLDRLRFLSTRFRFRR